MATRAVPVSEDQKDQDGVQEAVTIVGDLRIASYVKVEKVDDIDGKTTEDVETLKFSVPVLVDDDDAEVEEGKERPKVWTLQHREADLSKPNREKLLKALKPFQDASREAKLTITLGSRTGSGAGAGESAKVRAWAKENSIKVDGKPVNEMGRVPEAFVKLYHDAHQTSGS